MTTHCFRQGPDQEGSIQKLTKLDLFLHLTQTVQLQITFYKASGVNVQFGYVQ